MSFLNKQQLLKAQGRRYATVEVPELGGSVRLASPSAETALLMRELQRREVGEIESTAAMLEAAVVDENGARIFDAKSVREFIRSCSPELVVRLVKELTALWFPSTAAEGSAASPPSASSSPGASPSVSV